MFSHFFTSRVPSSSSQQIQQIPRSSTDSLTIRVTTTVHITSDTPQPPPPPPHTPPTAYFSQIRSQNDMMIDFFGGRRSTSKNPPPYSSRENPPSYPGHPDHEPATLARYMFLYGFCALIINKSTSSSTHPS